MTERPELCAALPALVVVSGTASGLGTRIARQLVDCGVTTIGVDIAPQPDSLKNGLYVHMQGDVTQDNVWTAVGDEIRKAAPASVGLVTSAAMLEVGTILEFDRAAIEKTMAVNFVGTALGYPRGAAAHDRAGRRSDRRGGQRERDRRRAAALDLQRLQGSRTAVGANGRHGSRAAGHPRQCSQSRRHARGAIRTAYEIGERSGEVPGDAGRAPAHREESPIRATWRKLLCSFCRTHPRP